jgi:predicted secreted protein
MAVGRKLLLKKNSTLIAGLRNVTISWSGGSIDLTSGEDNGIRLLDDLPAEEAITISGEGVMKEELFRNLILANPGTTKKLTDITVEFPILNAANDTAATLACDFSMTAFEEGAPYKDAITFSLTLESSGEWTYTAESAS